MQLAGWQTGWFSIESVYGDSWRKTCDGRGKFQSIQHIRPLRCETIGGPIGRSNLDALYEALIFTGYLLYEAFYVRSIVPENFVIRDSGHEGASWYAALGWLQSLCSIPQKTILILSLHFTSWQKREKA